MNTPQVAAALNTISMAFAELAEALSDGTAPVLARPVARQEPPEELFPPSEYEDLPVAATPQNEPVLSRCPFHDRAWTVKEAGISKAGKPYNAFWKCDAKDGDVYCPRKPVKAWADAHSPA